MQVLLILRNYLVYFTRKIMISTLTRVKTRAIIVPFTRPIVGPDNDVDEETYYEFEELTVPARCQRVWGGQLGWAKSCRRVKKK